MRGESTSRTRDPESQGNRCNHYAALPPNYHNEAQSLNYFNEACPNAQKDNNQKASSSCLCSISGYPEDEFSRSGNRIGALFISKVGAMVKKAFAFPWTSMGHLHSFYACFVSLRCKTGNCSLLSNTNQSLVQIIHNAKFIHLRSLTCW